MRRLVSVNKHQGVQADVLFSDVTEFFLPAVVFDCELAQLSLESPDFLILSVVGSLSLDLGDFPPEGALERLSTVVIMLLIHSLQRNRRATTLGRLFGFDLKVCRLNRLGKNVLADVVRS